MLKIKNGPEIFSSLCLTALHHLEKEVLEPMFKSRTWVCDMLVTLELVIQRFGKNVQTLLSCE